MIELRRRPSRRAVAGVAVQCCRHVARRLAAGLHAVMAAGAAAPYFVVVEMGGRDEGGRRVALAAILGADHVRRGLGRRADPAAR